jgi:hypothetical protein
MSRFERAAWSWYNAHATPFAFEAGIVGRALDRLGLGEAQERMFVQALNMIRQAALKIQMADARN